MHIPAPHFYMVFTYFYYSAKVQSDFYKYKMYAYLSSNLHMDKLLRTSYRSHIPDPMNTVYVYLSVP